MFVIVDETVINEDAVEEHDKVEESVLKGVADDVEPKVDEAELVDKDESVFVIVLVAVGVKEGVIVLLALLEVVGADVDVADVDAIFRMLSIGGNATAR